jgi:hypothetical protein
MNCWVRTLTLGRSRDAPARFSMLPSYVRTFVNVACIISAARASVFEKR